MTQLGEGCFYVPVRDVPRETGEPRTAGNFRQGMECSRSLWSCRAYGRDQAGNSSRAGLSVSLVCPVPSAFIT